MFKRPMAMAGTLVLALAGLAATASLAPGQRPGEWPAGTSPGPFMSTITK